MDNEFNSKDRIDFSGFWLVTTFQYGREDNNVFKGTGHLQSYEGLLADITFLVREHYQIEGEFHINVARIGKNEIVLFQGIPKLTLNGPNEQENSKDAA